jgi:hypothetical protein
MRLLSAILLSLPFVLHPYGALGSIGDVTVDVVGEYEGASTYGMKIFLLPHADSEYDAPAPDITARIIEGKFGFFLGGKFSTNKPDGKNYNWSQSRAESFYKSEFRGYSDKELYGFNCGLTYSPQDHFYVYSGMGNSGDVLLIS